MGTFVRTTNLTLKLCNALCNIAQNILHIYIYIYTFLRMSNLTYQSRRLCGYHAAPAVQTVAKVPEVFHDV
jgi:hypothetical protein